MHFIHSQSINIVEEQIQIVVLLLLLLLYFFYFLFTDELTVYNIIWHLPCPFIKDRNYVMYAIVSSLTKCILQFLLLQNAIHNMLVCLFEILLSMLVTHTDFVHENQETEQCAMNKHVCNNYKHFLHFILHNCVYDGALCIYVYMCGLICHCVNSGCTITQFKVQLLCFAFRKMLCLWIAFDPKQRARLLFIFASFRFFSIVHMQ